MSGFVLQLGADVSGATKGIKQVSKDMQGLATGSVEELKQQVKSLKAELSGLDATLLRSKGGKALTSELKLATGELKSLEKQSGLATGATQNLATKGFGLLRTAANILPGIGIAGIIGIIASGAEDLVQSFIGVGKASKDAKENTDKLKNSIEGVFSSVAKESTEVAGFVAILKSETETRKRKLEAIKELQKIEPDIFASLKLEGDVVKGLDTAYQGYLLNLKTVIAAKIKQAQLELLIEKQLKLQGVTLTESDKVLKSGAERVRKYQEAQAKAANQDSPFLGRDGKNIRDAKTLQDDIDGILKDLIELSNGIKTTSETPLKIKVPKVKIDASNIKLGQFGISNFDFDAATFKKIKIPKKKFSQFIEIGGEVTNENISGLSKAEKKAIEDAKELQKALDGINSSIQNLAVEELAQFGEVLGTALAGGDVKAAFSGFVNIIAQGFQSIGKELIAAAPVIKALKASLKTLSAPGLLIAGIGLVAVGAALRASVNKGISGRAAGGAVAAGVPVNVGEQGREVFVPSTAGRIIPNHLAGIAGQARQMLDISGLFRIAGPDLVLALSRQNAKQGRYFG